MKLTQENTMIKPVNGHLLIEPVVHDSFIATTNDKYQEIGVVVDIPLKIESIVGVKEGDKVFFDAWLAKRYPIEGTTDKFYWLVKWEDITAVEYVEPEPLQE
jgi:co-chaperonin GroES (HSP10)